LANQAWKTLARRLSDQVIVDVMSGLSIQIFSAITLRQALPNSEIQKKQIARALRPAKDEQESCI